MGAGSGGAARSQSPRARRADFRAAYRSKPVRVLGRLLIARRDMGRLAKPRYREWVQFEPAVADDRPRIRVGVTIDDQQLPKLLERLRQGDTPAILTGRMQQTEVRSHDGINRSTQTALAVERSQTLDRDQAAEVAGRLLEADDQQQFIARVTPVALGSLKIFSEQPVVHPELKNRYRSKVLVRYRVFNTGQSEVVLPAASVRLQLDGKWINCMAMSVQPTTIPAGGYAPATFRVYEPATAATPGQAVKVESAFALAGERKQVTDAVKALE
jgi:hypothetical protein